MTQSALMSFIWSSLRAVSSRTMTQRYPIGAMSRLSVDRVRIVTSWSALVTPHRIAQAKMSHVIQMLKAPMTSDQNKAPIICCCSACSNCDVESISSPSTDENRNRNEWLAIADFLARQNLRSVLAARGAAAPAAPGKGSAGAAGAVASAVVRPLPVGNHGEIYAKGQGL